MSQQHSDDEIKAAVRQLWSAWTKRPSEEEQVAWTERLRPYFAKPALKHAMRECAETSDWVPTIPALLARMRAIEDAAQSRSKYEPTLHILTAKEREKSDKAAVLSMLWLHHVKGWPTSAFSGTIFEERFAGMGQKAFEDAAKHYPRELLEAWMEDQKRDGN